MKIPWSKCEQDRYKGRHAIVGTLIVHNLGPSGICVQQIEGDGSLEEANRLSGEINKLLFTSRSQKRTPARYTGYILQTEVTYASHEPCSLSRLDSSRKDEEDVSYSENYKITYCAFFGQRTKLLHRFLEEVTKLQAKEEA